MRRELVMSLIIFLSVLTIPQNVEASGMNSEDPGVSDVVTWRVGDKWIYSGAFDPTVLVKSAGVDATVGTINGDSTTIVDAINEIDVAGTPTLVYETTSRADFDKGDSKKQPIPTPLPFRRSRGETKGRAEKIARADRGVNRGADEA